MGAIYFSKRAFEVLKRLDRARSRQIVGSLERIRIRPEKYVNRVITDPCYRLALASAYVYLDLVKDDIVVLLVKERYSLTVDSK